MNVEGVESVSDTVKFDKPVLDGEIPVNMIASVHMTHHYRKLVNMNLPLDTHSSVGEYSAVECDYRVRAVRLLVQA